MSSFIITAGKWGGIATIIVLVIALLKQLIALVGFLMVALKFLIIAVFVALMLLIVLTMLRARGRRRRTAEEI